MVRHTQRFHLPVAALMACAVSLLVANCSTNPATGKPQLALVGEQQEIAMGREAATQAAQQIGLYDDPELQAYVSRLGKELAAQSERPNLPWSFQVVDDPSVNAFALPGGFIFVTRGLLTHLTSEAELVSVLGHEIGHVTGRHSVEQMSKSQLAQIGLVAGMVLQPELASAYGDLAQQGLGLLFLKYGRDDEREADDLGLRYLVAENYDPREMPQVFETLRRVSERETKGGRVPGWLSTHPTPEDRIQRISSQVASLNRDFSQATVGRERYLQNLDGTVFGQNPREGYFRGNTFIQPELGFQITFPQGWNVSNQKQAVGAISDREDAVVVLTLSPSSSPQQAAQEFFSQQGIVQGQALQGSNSGAVSRTFGVQRGQSGDLQGIATFVEQGGKVYQILGYTLANKARGYENQLSSAATSFSRVTDRRLLDVEPQRVDIVSVPGAMTLQEFESRYPSTVDLQTLAIINQAQPTTRFEAGAEVKRVVGGAPAEPSARPASR
jgi:predicted Zn-dependent protease